MADPVPQIFIGPQDPTQSGWGGTFPPSPAGDQYVPYTGADVAALLSQPPGYSTDPVTGDTVAPSPNPQTPVPGAPIPNPPQPAPSGTIFTELGSFFGAGSLFGSRRYRPSRFEKDIARLATRVGMNAIRGAFTAARDYFGRPPPAETSTFVSTKVLPALERVGMGAGVAVGLAALDFGLMWAAPNPFQSLGEDKGGMFPVSRLSDPTFSRFVREKVRQQIAAERNAASVPDQTRSNAQIMIEEPFTIPPTAYPDYRPNTGLNLLKQIATDTLFGTNLGPFYLGQGRQNRGLGPLITPRADKLQPFTLPLDMGGDSADVTSVPGEPASTSSSPASSSPATPATTAAHKPLGIFQRIPGLPLALGLGGIAASAIVLSGRNRGGGTPAFIAPAAPITTPSQNVTPQTGVPALMVGNFQGVGSSGDCGCGPRGPRRKCLERAPVTWRSGRNKGKAAGSKCVRYAQRAS